MSQLERDRCTELIIVLNSIGIHILAALNMNNFLRKTIHGHLLNKHCISGLTCKVTISHPIK